jgi:predicted outer membrane protein
MARLATTGTAIPLLALMDLTTAPAAMAATAESSGYAEYRHRTLTISTISRRASELALTRANPQVQTFAKLELAEQITVEQVITNKINPSLLTLDAADSDALQHLASLPSGSQFDQAYVAAEISGHQKLLGLQEGLISQEGLGSNSSHIAYFFRTFIHEHLQLLAQLQKS